MVHKTLFLAHFPGPALKMHEWLPCAQFQFLCPAWDIYWSLQGNKIEYQENQSRRNNIRVFGIPESAGETWEMAETKVKDAIKEKLNIEVDIERAHRVERRKSGGINQHQADAKPRVIVCRLSSWKQKEAVVRKARKEKPEGLFICEDLSQATLEKRKPHLEKLKAAKQAGKSAYFILDRLIIRHKPFGSSND